MYTQSVYTFDYLGLCIDVFDMGCSTHSGHTCVYTHDLNAALDKISYTLYHFLSHIPANLNSYIMH